MSSKFYLITFFCFLRFLRERVCERECKCDKRGRFPNIVNERTLEPFDIELGGVDWTFSCIGFTFGPEVWLLCMPRTVWLPFAHQPNHPRKDWLFPPHPTKSPYLWQFTWGPGSRYRSCCHSLITCDRLISLWNIVYQGFFTSLIEKYGFYFVLFFSCSCYQSKGLVHPSTF